MEALLIDTYGFLFKSKRSICIPFSPLLAWLSLLGLGGAEKPPGCCSTLERANGGEADGADARLVLLTATWTRFSATSTTQRNSASLAHAFLQLNRHRKGKKQSGQWSFTSGLSALSIADPRKLAELSIKRVLTLSADLVFLSL